MDCPMDSEPTSQAWMRLKTEPMTQRELAEWFGGSERRIKGWLEQIDGAERIGRFWRLPLSEMPPAYLVSAGLIPEQPDVTGHNRTSTKSPNIDGQN